VKDHCDLGFSSFFPSFLPLQPWYRNPSPPISPFPQFPNPPIPPRHCFCDVCESRGWGPPTANQGQNIHDDEPPPPSQRTNDVIYCHVLTICHVALSLSLSLSLSSPGTCGLWLRRLRPMVFLLFQKDFYTWGG